MTITDFILVIGALWAVVGLVDLARSRRRGPAIIQHAGNRIFSAFWPSVLLHVGLFCLFYSALAYVLIQITTIGFLLAALDCIVAGTSIAVTLVLIIRERTDGTWLLRRWMTRDLKESKDPEAHLEALLEKIQSHPEEDSSKKALGVLKELSRKGDSTAGLVWKALEKHQLV